MLIGPANDISISHFLFGYPLPSSLFPQLQPNLVLDISPWWLCFQVFTLLLSSAFLGSRIRFLGRLPSERQLLHWRMLSPIARRSTVLTCTLIVVRLDSFWLWVLMLVLPCYRYLPPLSSDSFYKDLIGLLIAGSVRRDVLGVFDIFFRVHDE